MHARRIACLILGVWLGGSILIALIATQNFRSVNRILESPSSEVGDAVSRLGGVEAARLFLRHHVGEQNRFFFEHWEYVQIALGVGLFLLLLFGTHERKISLALSLAILAIPIATSFLLTPSIIALGRELDFVPQGEGLAHIRNQFRARHIAYSSVELVKLGLSVLLTVLLIRANGRRLHHPLDYDSTPRDRSASSIRESNSVRETSIRSSR